MKRTNKVTLADLPHVGRGTPAGDWFRRHWLVVGTTSDLRDIPQAVKVVGEELVLFRDDKNAVGLLGLHCPHRGASLEYGDIEDGGLRCPYHGWLFDVRDAARACRLALETNFSGHQAFNICAPDTIMDIPTLDLVSRYLSQVRDLREGLTAQSRAYSVVKAKTMLGFKAKLLLEK